MCLKRKGERGTGERWVGTSDLPCSQAPSEERGLIGAIQWGA